MIDSVARESRREVKRASQILKGVKVLRILDQLITEKGLREPDLVDSLGSSIALIYLSCKERRDYLDVTRQWRAVFRGSVSHFVNFYEGQNLVTEGTLDGVRIQVKVDVGLREGCTLTYETVTSQRPVITCA